MNAREPATNAADDQFFLAGDNGTYAGAPESLAPLALEEEPPRAADSAWLARRIRLQRLVIRTVTVLGVFSVLAPLARALRTRAGTEPAPVIAAASGMNDVPALSSVAPLPTHDTPPPASSVETAALAPISQGSPRPRPAHTVTRATGRKAPRAVVPAPSATIQVAPAKTPVARFPSLR